MAKVLDTVLLLALPASGKSEVRRYLDLLPAKEAMNDFHMGPTVQIDDFPYVHLMRRMDDELENLGKTRIYFEAPDRSFRDPRHWGTLIELVNEDYADLVQKKQLAPSSAAEHWFGRIDAACKRVGAGAEVEKLDDATRKSLADALEKETRELLEEKVKGYPDTLDGKTLVIEFARGGKDGSSMPLAEPFGYQYSVGKLAPEILEKATILYIWVTPEESRRKNTARADPDDPGSILHHGVPLYVMMNDYGCDDLDWLEANAKKPGTVTISARGRTFDVPVARFDNRVDRTTFVRDDRSAWKPEDVKALHTGLQGALDKLAKTVG